MIKVNISKKLQYFDLKVQFSADKEVLVIQGPSGSGKTTLLDCISGLKLPDQGEISLDNRAVFSSDKSINLPIKDRHIGYVFQNYALFPHLTIKENIAFGVKNRKEKDLSYVNYIMEVLKLTPLENRFPSEISGGEKQRTALARALAIKPQLLLMDEPFSALDKSTRKIVYEEFLEFKKLWNIDTLLITHNDEEAKLLGDKTIKIKDGVLL